MAAKILRASDVCMLYAMLTRVGQSCGRTVGNAPASTMLPASIDVPSGQRRWHGVSRRKHGTDASNRPTRPSPAYYV